MRTALIASVLLCALPAGSLADKSKVSRGMIQSMEASMDKQLLKLWPDDPVQVVGLTQGAYISGYGAVFMSEVNLAPGATITPFHQTMTKDEIARMHDKKMTRLPKLKEAMQNMLLSSAASLDTVPPDEQVALGITLFYWHGVENTEGLPAQIVMHAPRRVLVSLKTGLRKSSPANAVTVEQY